MPSTLHIAFLLAASTISATKAQQSGQEDYISSICSPTNATGFPDVRFPCNQAQAVLAQCVYGVSGIESIADVMEAGDSIPVPQSNATQQVCFCQSSFWSLTNACGTCYEKHGDTSGDFPSESAISSISSKYCAATATPSLGLADYLYQFASDYTGGDSSTKTSDPVGNKTDVSYYYTASVTGTKAWVVADPTATSKMVKDGQIVATATGKSDGAKEGAADGRKTGVVAAVLGLAGFASLLII